MLKWFHARINVFWVDLFQGMKKVRATGIGVHTPEEIIQMGKDDLQVLTDMLGDKPFFFGEEPTTVSFSFFFYFPFPVSTQLNNSTAGETMVTR